MGLGRTINKSSDNLWLGKFMPPIMWCSFVTWLIFTPNPKIVMIYIYIYIKALKKFGVFVPTWLTQKTNIACRWNFKNEV
jgi:hypothetical protein